MTDAAGRRNDNAAKAAEILAALRGSARSGAVPEEDFYKALRRAICFRLMVDEDDADTDDLRNLCVLSIKRQMRGGSGISDSEIGKQIEKYDCHQTNLVTQKKVLLMLYIEKSLGIRLDDDESAGIRTVWELAGKCGEALKSSKTLKM